MGLSRENALKIFEPTNLFAVAAGSVLKPRDTARSSEEDI
jgi:hypothetical protein